MASCGALSPEDYAVAWIAALHIERAAAEAMLDEEHATPAGFVRHKTDTNSYSWGRIGDHNIVIASLAAGDYGITSAATTASRLIASLPSIRIGLLVGIGGGIARPDDGRDIRLGDIVVSQDYGTTGGVCQYDLGRAGSGGKWERAGFLGRPPTVLLNALSGIQSAHERKDSKVPAFIRAMLEENPKMGTRDERNPGYMHQGSENDRLFKATYEHVEGSGCRNCDPAGEIQRAPRDTSDPEIYYGIIASGNTLVKDATTRDRIAGGIGDDCICFEMEAAGLMNHFPCLVIRGICDYADSHKNYQWQRYASATAAGYAKELLAYVPAVEVQKTQKVTELLESIAKTTNEAKASLDHIKSDYYTRKIKTWLDPPDPSTNFNQAKKFRHDGTGTWLLNSADFRSWRSGSRRYLWLYGLAGCGKTVLSATVLEHLALAKDHLVMRFFFSFVDAKKQTLDGMLRSFAFQLYQSSAACATHLGALYQVHQAGHNQPATTALSEIIGKMLAEHEKVFIVLDALDESTTTDAFLSWMEDIAFNSKLCHVRLLCTSRPELEFQRNIPKLIGDNNYLSLNKNAINTEIQSYVTAQLKSRRFRGNSLPDDLLERIRSKVGNGADGMFRWAHCQLESLAKCRHVADIEKALTDLPQSLNETYRRMLGSIRTEVKEDAMRLLQFLLHCKRPLRLDEAVDVIATGADDQLTGFKFDIKRRLFNESDVLDYCPNLITVVGGHYKELHLSHFSVKEFLLTHNKLKLPTASISITRTCLTYLTDIDDSPTLADRYIQYYSNYHCVSTNPHHIQRVSDYHLKFPLAYLAAEMWVEFAVLAETEHKTLEAILELMQTQALFKKWCRLCHLHDTDFDQDHDSYGMPLLQASRAGLYQTAERLLNMGADINAEDKDWGNALSAASRKGRGKIVTLLLDRGANVNARPTRLSGAALQVASKEGHGEVVKLLLKHGADINSSPSDLGDTALIYATRYGRIEVVKLLLDHGADVNQYSDMSGTALHTASREGYGEILKLLLGYGADINQSSDVWGSALHIASENGQSEIVRLLIDHGVDVNQYSDKHGTALQTCSKRGDTTTLKLLLDHIAVVGTRENELGICLHKATRERRYDAMDLLLQRGAHVDSIVRRWSPLYVAYFNRDIRSIKLLLERGADINKSYLPGILVLLRSRNDDHDEITKLLLEHKATINV